MTADLDQDLSTSSTPACARRRALGRRLTATLAAGGLLAGLVGLAVPVTASAAGWGGHGGGGSYGYPGGSSQRGTGQASTADSGSATAAESSGVALIDTVLTNGEAAGTGIVLTSDGEVLTNYHVVEGSTSIKVTIPTTGASYTASVVGSDQSADVALLQLKHASGLTVAKIDDDTVQLGDDVTAVGNAGGTSTLSAADGEVTDLSASITTQSEGTVVGESLTKMIETSSDVVPGDSGGPLLDDQGEVIGIDTAASSGREIDGYAIPIAVAMTVVTQIQSGDETAAVRIGPAAFLGVEVASSTASDSGYGYGAGTSGTPTGSGAAIAGVVDGDAADEAGLAAGDTITQLGTTTISSAGDLTTILSTLEPGDQTKLVWTTADGQTQSATVTLDPSPVN